jgi:formamidopyrimidine-DNA glycosylase
MPELPEVETVKRGLERTILGKVVQGVEVRVPKLFSDDRGLIDQVLVGAKVVGLERRAKVLLIHLSSDWTLAVHLKMTGQLIVVGPDEKKPDVEFVGGHPEKAYEQPLPHKHTHIIVTFTDGTHLYFNDLRKFGWMRLFPHEASVGYHTIHEFLEALQLGPEPLSEDFTEVYLAGLLKGRSIPIKQLLLEQKGISGIGNIYADEALFFAKIHPRRPATKVTASEIRLLTEGIKTVLEKGIAFGGTSKNTYRNVEGTKGEMQKYLMVYGREELPCKVCGTLISRIKIGQRSSHFCTNCQK